MNQLSETSNKLKRRKKRITRRIVDRHNEALFLSMCHHNAGKFYSKLDAVLSAPTVLFPLIAGSTLVLQLGTECDNKLNLVAATLDILTTGLVVCKRVLKVDLRQKNHENMSMFYQEAKRDMEYFLGREHSVERVLAFEEMVNEKLNTLSLIAEDIPLFIESKTDKQMKSEQARALARADIMIGRSPAMAESSDSNTSPTDSATARDSLMAQLPDPRNSTAPGAAHGTPTPQPHRRIPIHSINASARSAHAFRSSGLKHACIEVESDTGTASLDADSRRHADAREHVCIPIQDKVVHAVTNPS